MAGTCENSYLTYRPLICWRQGAKIVSRKGRDLATMWADKDALWVWFADNPNGSDSYELDISFGR